MNLSAKGQEPQGASEDWDARVGAILDELKQVEGSFLDDLAGCGEHEIARLGEVVGHPLPAALASLLRRCGRSWGDLMRGEDFRFPEMIEYRQVARSLLANLAEEMQVDLTEAIHPDDVDSGVPRGASGLELHDRDFVFMLHQGYQFFFLRVGGADDPPVFHYNHDDPGFNRVSDTFTEWLEICVREEVASNRQRRRGAD